MSTLLLSGARGFAQATGNEIDVILSDHKIKLKAVNPDKTDELGRAWDDQQFVSGNIHHEEYANPIDISVDEDSEDYDVILSQKYKDYMKQTLMRDIIDETAESSKISVFTAVIILVSMQMLTTTLLIAILVM